jgi:uncharacterized membrane protein YozB (DUF420 family)
LDGKLIFWTVALANLAVVTTLVGIAVRSVRAGDVARHRRCMIVSGCLVGGFVAAYALKLCFLGRELLESWSGSAIWMLRIHELCVLVMLIGGGTAGWRAYQMRSSRNVTHESSAARAPTVVATWHRRAGWSAVIGAGLALLTASMVLVGMYQRANFF